ASTFFRLVRPRGRPSGTPALPGDVTALAARVPDAGRLARYRELLGLPDGPELPLLYPHVLAGRLHLAMLAAPDFPLSMLGAVHTRTHVRRHGPLPAHAAYGVRAWFEGQRPVKGGLEFTLATELLRGSEAV